MKSRLLIIAMVACSLFGVAVKADPSSDLYRTGAGDFLKIGGDRNELMYSSDGGNTWNVIFTAYRIWKISARASDKIWVGYRCGAESACVKYSENKGRSWITLPYEFAYAVRTLYAAPNGQDIVMDADASSSFSYFISNDGGKTFNESSVLPPFFIQE